MYSKIFLNVLLIIGLVAIQQSFINNLSAWFNNLNLVLVILVFILGLSNFKLALCWAIGLGFMLDIFSFLPFGIYLTCLSLTIILTHLLLTNFFTNRSLYSFLALTILATVYYNLFFYSIIYIDRQISGPETVFGLGVNFWQAKLVELGLNMFAALIIFYLVNFISNKLKPVFLVRR